MCVITYLPMALHCDLKSVCHYVLSLHEGYLLRLWFCFVMQILQLREGSNIKIVRQRLQITIKRKMPFFVCSE